MFKLEDQILVDKKLEERLRNAGIFILNYRIEHREHRGTVKFAELTVSGDESIRLTSRKLGCSPHVTADDARYWLGEQATQLKNIFGKNKMIVGYYLKDEKAEEELGPLKN